jgi:hypothetical protein
VTLLFTPTLLFGVVGVNLGDVGAAADTSAAAVAATAPLAPTSVTALPGNGRVRLVWSRPLDDGGDSITSFSIVSTPGSASMTVAAGLQEADVADLTNGTSYTFTVTATNHFGSGTPSPPTGPVTPAAPGYAAPQKLVRALYVDFLQRLPTAVETDGYGPRLLYQSVTAVALDLASSNEWVSTLVTQFYFDTLGRAPDSAGLADWVRSIRSGAQSVASAAAQFYASDEYFKRFGHSDLTTWVRDLYRKILRRDPDPSGLATWVQAATTAGRVALVERFYESPESTKGRVTVLYRKLLGRAPDPDGLALWSSVLPFGGDLALAATLAGGPEYFARAQARF